MLDDVPPAGSGRLLAGLRMASWEVGLASAFGMRRPATIAMAGCVALGGQRSPARGGLGLCARKDLHRDRARSRGSRGAFRRNATTLDGDVPAKHLGAGRDRFPALRRELRLSLLVANGAARVRPTQLEQLRNRYVEQR